MEWERKLYFPNVCQVKVRKTKTERHTGNEEDLGFDGNKGKYYQFECRGVEQRIYLDELDSALENHGVVLLESYYKTLDFLKKKYETSVDFASTFISPFHVQEIKELTEQGTRLEDYLPDLMLDSLIKRAEKNGKTLTRYLIKELELRAEDSVNEMRFAHKYQYVITNHCFESDSRWELPVLIGEPKSVVNSLYNIIVQEEGNIDYVDKGSNYSFLINNNI
ncbi:MAG: hypothetical protein KJ583_04940 [Nanoarchaeota archaeon]|nr:hypothetical protein [Nanoarchaeota archaeon]MBU1269734.1 hypothetical protein [Nanoarchaeota archaeon]MBU1604636.1 hypothetical protein [Nanoarchaeota archaeon]MBU2443297.1 hypothetical protein [Nanoarchaeota archaeon]